jgi:phosphatidylserine synthase 2
MEYGSQLLFLVTFAYISQALFYTHESTEHNVKAGLVGVVLVFIAQSSLRPYKSPFTRVRDRWCRVGARTGLLYIGLLVFVLFQKASDARTLPVYIEPTYGKELPLRSENYDRDCELSYSNVSKIVDYYVITHFVNWLLAAFIIRDYYILHIWSVLDELIELSLKNIRPNFAECWWDSVILDVLVANTLGIYIGMKIVQWIGTLKYDWLGRENTNSVKEWKVWTSHRHFQGCFCLLIFVSLNFVAGFTVSNSLWIPASSYLNIIRLVIWFITGALGFREAYDDIRTWGDKIRGTKQIYAQYRWAGWMMQCSEMLLSWKFREGGGNRLDQTVYPSVIFIWTTALSISLGYWVYLRFFYKYRQYKDGRYMDVTVTQPLIKKNS